MEFHLIRRMRRNRSSPAIRGMVRETSLDPADLVQPLFVIDGSGPPEPVASMPGVFRYSIDDAVAQCRACADLGIPAVAIFPCVNPAFKDEIGSHAIEEGNVLFRAVRAIKEACLGILIITDAALDPYTSHGHDGLLDSHGTTVLNDETVEALCRLSVREAEAGADIVAPSDMMDGRILAIRHALDRAGYQGTGILAYSAKYASSYYGPFREAVGSSSGGAVLDKREYQMDPANVREALLEVQLDEQEGADIVMVKPAGPYLDVIRAVRNSTSLPLAAYQVSGEYAQIHAAARLGWLDYEATRDESLLAIKRAGADLILTYFAIEAAGRMRAVRR